MPTIHVQTIHGMPAFTLTAGPGDTIAKLQIMAAKKARVMKQIWKDMKLKDDKDTIPVRLSLGNKFLSPNISLSELGLKDGSVLLLHVKATPLVKGTSAPLPSYSFLGDGFDFFVNIVTGVQGRPLFRLKVSRSDLIEKVIGEAVRRAVVSGIDEVDASAVKMRHKRLPLRKDKSIESYAIGRNDTLELFGLPSDKPQPSPRMGIHSPRAVSATKFEPERTCRHGSSSHNMLAYTTSARARSPPGSRPHSASASMGAGRSGPPPRVAQGHIPVFHASAFQEPIWLPTGMGGDWHQLPYGHLGASWR